MPTSVFFAYPSNPLDISIAINRAIVEYRLSHDELDIHPWEENDISGVPITKEIFERIERCDMLFADISNLNLNVVFEIGYAIGFSKRTVLLRSTQYDLDESLRRTTGIFDTIGHSIYSSSTDIVNIFLRPTDSEPLHISDTRDKTTPIYIVEPAEKNTDFLRILSNIKKLRLPYRSFNPFESRRISVTDAIENVAKATGVVISILDCEISGAKEHNIRSAFIAGLSMALSRELLILNPERVRVPLDIVNISYSYSSPVHIDRHIENFAMRTFALWQELKETHLPKLGLLEDLSLGDPTAENEFQTLDSYYIQTAQYASAIRGEVNLAVGRKGSGKTALFSQVRNRMRKDKENIVVDLKPESYQLVRLRDEILSKLHEGVQLHLITAFWEYIILLEIAFKILEKDKTRHKRDQILFRLYTDLEQEYCVDHQLTEGDFSERLQKLSDVILARFRNRKDKGGLVTLNNSEVTEILYKHDIRNLRRRLIKYLERKKKIVLLFDNLDKGWPPGGIKAEDVVILRCLIDAARKLKNDMIRDKIDFIAIVFIRDDVYRYLVHNTPDFGKDSRASLDWDDPLLLSELLSKRLSMNWDGEHGDFAEMWSRICVPYHEGRSSSDYMIRMSLMRPRNLIKIFNHCRGYAINFGHSKILSTDIERGLKAFSDDLLVETDQEIKDVFPIGEGLVYGFIAEPCILSADLVGEIFKKHGVKNEDFKFLMTLLFYYCFLGIVTANGVRFLYDFSYDNNKLEALRQKNAGLRYCIHPAFWKSLEIVVSADDRNLVD